MIKHIISARNIALAIIVATFAMACSCSKKGGDKLADAEPVDVVRLDRLSARFSSLGDSLGTLEYNRNKHIINQYLTILDLDTIEGVRSMCMWSNSLPVAMFAPPADSVFTDSVRIDKTIGSVLARAKDNGIDLPERQYVAVVWGRNEAIMFANDIMFIALNHYLGEHHQAYARWAEYRRALKRPDMLPYDIAEALVATQLPYQAPNEGENVLSRMLYEGALTEAKMRLVSDAQAANALGFSERQYADVQKNETFIWNRLVNEKLLYSTDQEVLHRMFDLLPYSSVISAQAPGRTARYTGWRIVQSYLKKHPETTLSQLLSPEFYNNPDILREAEYTIRN